MDVQIGPQLVEAAPQELRSRLWLALIDNPLLCHTYDEGKVHCHHGAELINTVHLLPVVLMVAGVLVLPVLPAILYGMAYLCSHTCCKTHCACLAYSGGTCVTISTSS